MKAAVWGFHRAIASFIGGDFPLIIDHVIFGDLMYDDLILNLGSNPTLFVGVHCSIDTLKAKEVARNN